MSRRRRFIVRRIVWFLILLVVGIWLASLVAVVVPEPALPFLTPWLVALAIAGARRR